MIDSNKVNSFILRVWLSKNQPHCPQAKIFFRKLGRGIMGRSPETKKPAPDPPKGLRGPFFDFRAAQPCFVTIFVFDFFLINFGTFA